MSSDVEGKAAVGVKNEDSQITFVLGQQRTRSSISRAFLALRAPAFLVELELQQQQPDFVFEYPEITPKAFETFLKHLDNTLLSDALSTLSLLELFELFQVAKIFNPLGLMTKLLRHFQHRLTINNVFEIYERAVKDSALVELEQSAVQFMVKNGVKALEDDTFLTLSLQSVFRLLSCPEITKSLGAVCLFEAVHRWALYKTDERVSTRQLMEPLLPHLSFTDMTAAQVTKSVRPAAILTCKELVELYAVISSPNIPLPEFLKKRMSTFEGMTEKKEKIEPNLSSMNSDISSLNELEADSGTNNGITQTREFSIIMRRNPKAEKLAKAIVARGYI